MPGVEGAQGVQVVARVLNLTPRRVQQLAKAGVLPSAGRGRYNLVPCVHAFLKYWQDRAESRSPTRETILDLQAKKLEIEVEVAELALAQQRGQLVTLDYMEGQVRGLMESLRARCLNMPGKFARDLAETTDPASALVVLERLSTELLQALSEAGEDPELDEESEEEPGVGAA